VRCADSDDHRRIAAKQSAEPVRHRPDALVVTPHHIVGDIADDLVRQMAGVFQLHDTAAMIMVANHAGEAHDRASTRLDSTS
jgi:hypothetical protein